MSKQHQPDKSTPNQPVADDFQQVLESFVRATSDAVYQMSADWQQMHQLVGKSFLLDTTTTNSSWLQQYIPPQDQQPVQTVIDQAIRAKKPFELEHRVIRADGRLGWTFSRAIPLLDKQGEITKWFGTASDITDRKQAEEALAQSEEKYRTLFNSMDEAVSTLEIIFDENNKAVDWLMLETNPAMNKMTGWTSEVVGKKASEYIPDAEAFWFEAVECVVKTGEPIRIEHPVAGLNDNWYEMYIAKVGGEGSRQVVCVYNNITERKRQQANLAFLAEVSQDLAGLTNIDQTMDAIGEKTGRYLNVTRCMFVEIHESENKVSIIRDWCRPPLASFGDLTISQFVTEDFRQKSYAGEIIVINDVHQSLLVDGRQVADVLGIEAFVNVPLLRDGQWRFTLGIYDAPPRHWREDEIDLMRELTTRIWTRLERARTEEALRDSEERLQLALKGASIFTWEVDPATSVTRYSENFNQVLGFELSPISEENFLHIYPDDKDFVTRAVGKALTGEAPLDVEHRIIHPQTGALIWVRAQGQLANRSAEAVPVLIGVTQNITTHKEAEDALRKLEQRNRLALEAAEMATWEWDLLTDQVYWNEQHFYLLGMAVQPNPLPAEAFTDHLHPDDAESIKAQLAEAIAQRSLYDAEFRIVRDDGVVRWMSGYGRVIAEQGGQPVRVSGVMFDITDRKEAENALRANQERFRTLVQNLPDYAIFQIDPEGIITEWTEGAQRVKGYTAKEVIGQSIALFYTPEGLAAGELTTEMAQAAQQGRAERESVRIRKGGERFWVDEIMTAIHDGAGQLMGFTKISRDITERKVAERAIRDSQQRLQIVLDSIADHAIITTDPQSRITGWNPGAQQLFGYVAEEAIGQSLAIIFTPEDRAAGELEAELALARREGRAPDERYHLRKDGFALYVSGVLSPLYEADGELLGYVKVARDLTERRRMEQALREADGRKDEFLAMLAHELRNPLAPIRNGLQILSLTVGANPDLTPLVELMSRQLTHLVRLVDDLLDVSRISQGKIELKRERLDLRTLVGGAVEAARPLYQTRGKTLELALPTIPLFINGDATRLAQVVTNLLTNGSRYTGEAGRVRVTLESVPGEARLRVADNGIGLEPEQLEAIFELFVQVDNSVARSQGGLGLGLTLVKRLVELHGGRVEVRSAGLGQGSEFRVYLPLLSVDRPSLTLVEATPQPTGQPSLLVIDDNADSALTLAMLLKLKGYQVHTRTSGRAGLEAAEQLRPAVILLDLGMPDLDGYETCRLLRQQPWGEAVPVIALTGYGQAEDQRRTREAGFTAHLVKPVDLVALTQLLTQLAGKS